MIGTSRPTASQLSGNADNASSDGTTRPAIVLITCDELRADALSCYGGRAVETPHLDRLAREGVRFTRAYTASPWCLPSRASLITGLYPHHHRAYSNFRDCRLDPSRPNLYHALRAAGYRTAHAGKCHYAPVPYGETKPDRTLPYDAFHAYYRSLGIDDLDLQDDKQVSVWFYDDYARELEQAGHLAAYRAAVWDRSAAKVFAFPAPAEWHPDAWVGRKAVERVARHPASHSAGQPLFLWASFSGPHFPFDAPAEYQARVRESEVGIGIAEAGEFDDPARLHYASFHGPGGIEGAGSAPGRACKHYDDEYWRRLRRTYFANVALLDDQIGALLQAIEQRFGDNALVLFSADHGEMLGNHRLWGKNNCAYEDVWRVPLLARFPAGSAGATLHGTSPEALVSLVDVAPTCLRAAGLMPPDSPSAPSEPPAPPAPPAPGASRADIAATGAPAAAAMAADPPMPLDGLPLEEQVARSGRPFVLAEGERFVAISDGTTKYVTAQRSGRRYRELFDLDADPHEFRTVLGHQEYAARHLRLADALEQTLVEALLP